MRFSPSKSLETDYLASRHTKPFIHPKSLKKFVENAVKLMKTEEFKKRYPDYDTIAFSGYSGALIAPIIALALGKELVLVRKPSDVRASRHDVEGYGDVKNYIIVDDFVCSGDTAKRIIKSIKGFAPDAKCLGVLSVLELEGTDNFYNRTSLEHVKGCVTDSEHD